ncbi:MAG TPA: ATP-grasp domain-containing protein [Acidobacteriota bacterium]|nr:ATP-grasp domain-containing protein [Acidobacteriota bacterium]
MPSVLILIPATTYRAEALLAVAAQLGLDVVVGTNRHQALEALPGTATLTLDFADEEASRKAISAWHDKQPLAAILGPDEETTLLAASAAEDLGLAGNPPPAVAAARDKLRMRQQLATAGVPGPKFWNALPADIETLANEVTYPCVIKPTFLSASRGVIRANSPDELLRATARIVELLEQPDVRERRPEDADELLIESYLPGVEVAVEGLLTDGALHLLAIFDKPDPLEGPYFEETVYTTPSRLPEHEQRAAVDATETAAAALGLSHGPVHAEVRINEGQAKLLEIAPRSIGGRCGRVLRFGTDISLEEVVMRAALGYDVGSLMREPAAAGVMMILIPQDGTLRKVEGLTTARSVQGIVEITVSILRGQAVVPLPEGNRYLGFICARGATPSDVEASLRRAHAQLRFTID